MYPFFKSTQNSISGDNVQTQQKSEIMKRFFFSARITIELDGSMKVLELPWDS